MEAEGIYEFNATQADELSFRKGKTLKILNKEDDHWFKAECDGKEGYVPANYVKMEEPPWYKGKISRHEAEEMLLKCSPSGIHVHPDGAFVVRRSESDDSGHSLSVKHGNGVQHFKILQEKSSGKYFLWTQRFNSINKLVEYHRTTSVSKQDSQTAILLRDMGSGNKPAQHAQRHVGKCQALYKFSASDHEELSFDKGDVMDIVKKVDENWWCAELHGHSGLVPSNYVKEI